MPSLTPAIVDFIGAANRVRKGTDWQREVNFTDSDGNPVSMLVYQPGAGGLARMAIKDRTLATTYLSTSAGTIGLTWTGASQLRIWIPATASAAITGSLPATCLFHVEARQGATGLIDRILEGRIEMDEEVVTTAT